MNYKAKFFKRGLMLTAVALAMRTVGMFFGAYISGKVGAEGVGLYTVIMTVYSFAITLATSGVSLTVTRLVASAIGEGREGDIGGILRGAIAYSLAFGFLSGALLFIFAPFIAGHILFDDRCVDSLKMLAFSLVPISVSSVLSGYFIGVKRVGFNAAASVLSQVVKISATVMLVRLSLPYGMVAAVTSLCTGIVLTELLSFLVVFLEFLFDRRKNANKSKKNTSFMLSPVVKMATPLALSAYVRSVLLSVEHVLIPKRLRDRGESSSEA